MSKEVYVRVPNSENESSVEEDDEVKRVKDVQPLAIDEGNSIQIPLFGTSRKHVMAGGLLVSICIAAFGTMLYFVASTSHLGSGSISNSAPTGEGLKINGSCAATSDWSGWKSMKYSFIFGDFWTDTSFNPFYPAPQPSPSNPLGNPPFPGQSSANATNWVGFLTAKHNASQLLTYNLAVSGATLDNHIIQGYPSPLTSQVYGRFMPTYGAGDAPPWNASTSLFAMFAGVVDCVMMNGIQDEEVLADVNIRLTARLMNLLEALYGAGARNFLLLNVPSLERTWQPIEGEKLDQLRKKSKLDVRAYNARIEVVALKLKRKFSDVNVFLYDTNTLINKALDDVKAFPETSGILNTTEPCPEYGFGTPTTGYLLPMCCIPVNQYFWLNGLHPTYPIHDVLAGEIAKLLRVGPNVC